LAQLGGEQLHGEFLVREREAGDQLELEEDGEVEQEGEDDHAHWTQLTGFGI
jgi:hypothetical protein